MTPNADEILAASSWPNNASLINDVAQLGYIGDSVLDLSFGAGGFWSTFRPPDLTTNDIDPGTGADYFFDVRSRPPEDWWYMFDTTVWDGPYRLSGTRDRGAFDARYGLDNGYSSIAEVLDLLRSGIDFATTCTKAGGSVLVKCQDQVSSGKKVWQSRILANYGEHNGLTLVDQFHLVRPPRPQPRGRTQRTSRSNYSTLLVFRVHNSS